jgi:hypothetical protein
MVVMNYHGVEGGKRNNCGVSGAGVAFGGARSANPVREHENRGRRPAGHCRNRMRSFVLRASEHVGMDAQVQGNVRDQP